MPGVEDDILNRFEAAAKEASEVPDNIVKELARLLRQEKLPKVEYVIEKIESLIESEAE